ncbi:MAG: hypothetical protein C4534_09730 [Gaiellales bacterium]|nr:MAG: hypothetical protein C4534_09730 [Gaiellales bacterium]
MSKKRRRQVGRVTVAALITLLVAMSAFTAIFLSSQEDAQALSASEWEYVRQALEDFVAAQYQYDSVGGESGFITDAATLKTQIDSNNDGIYLGEGDDAANAPVLVDVLENQATWIPATSSRSYWNGSVTTTTGPTLGTTSVNQIAGRVDAHEAAGFSTDVVVYCATGHTESAAAGGLAAVSYAGGLGGSTPPKVLAFKWGRYGWGPTGSKTYSNTNTMVAPGASGGPYSDGTGPAADACAGSTPTTELVRCVAEWALSTTGGNVGNGANPPLSTYQAVDLRPATITETVDGGGAGNDLSIPIDTAFTTGLNNLDPAGTKKLFVNRTQHTAGMIATGAEMLGYDSAFLQWGLPNYNNGQDEKFTGPGPYAQVTTPVDFTAPVISNVAATGTIDGATITWSTDEPATSVLEWSLTEGGPYTKVNDTVLHAAHSMTITGQAPGARIYYRVSSYDGQANGGTPTSEGSVTVNRTINHTTDNVYYMPWYDDTSIWGWMGSWVVVGNVSGSAVDVELRVDGVIKGANAAIAAGDSWFQRYPNLNDGMVEVICFGCKTAGNDLVVSQRAIFKNTFNEYIATEWDDLSDTWHFPWYDNTKAWGVNGAWIVIANPDTTDASVAITIDGAAIAESPVNVPAGTVVPVKVAATTNSGPVLVDATGGQKLLVTQRVLFRDSFNEVAGLPIPTP